MGISCPGEQLQWLSIASTLTLDHQQWNFPLEIWHFAIASILVVVVSLNQWKPVQTDLV